MSAQRSISFDRAAPYYDATRGLSPGAMQKVVALLIAEIEGRGPSLEVGIGTGRMGLTLWEAGVDMAGVDLSAAMLGTLIKKAGGFPPFPLAVADAARLPFPDATFEVCLVCHVLHLIPRWKEALSEMVRVLRPRGTILVDAGSASQPEDERDQVMEEFARLAGYSNERAGVEDAEEIDAEMRSLGTVVRLLPAVSDEKRGSLEELIHNLEEGIYSITWQSNDRALRTAGEAVRPWARQHFGELDEVGSWEWTVQWRAYDLPGPHAE
jgi:ubiquinone/menaquinone biosynthesis C-methylase UbiE